MKLLKKIVLIIVCLAVAATCLFGCKPGSDDPGTTDPSNPTEDPGAENPEDAPASTEIVAKVGDIPVYTSEFYYFLYQGIRELYYQAEGVYDDEATDEDNMKAMKEYFYSQAEDGKTYLEKAADRTLEIVHGFNIAYLLGKQAAEKNEKYAVSQEYLDNILSYIDSEADYGSYSYGMSRDDYFFSAYGMNVNEAKRYTQKQLYAEMHETVWADEQGYSVGMDAPEQPTEPVAPAKPGEGADEETLAQYHAELAAYEAAAKEYGEKKAAYDTALAAYNQALDAYFEKFRGEYQENESVYRIPTVQYLYLDTTDEEGNRSETVAAEKRANAEKYLKLVNEEGYDFAGIVKGFSESATVASDGGLMDVSVYGESYGLLPYEVVEWALNQSSVSEKAEMFETENAIFLVTVVGITDFDKTEGKAADPEATSPDTVRGNVEYAFLAELYNKMIEETMLLPEFALSEVNKDKMLELAKQYLEYTEE